MKLWTVDEVLAQRPCGCDGRENGRNYTRERLQKLFGKRKRITVRDVLPMKDVPAADKVWCATRPGALPLPILIAWMEIIAERRVTVDALRCGIEAVERWACRWLDGTDRSEATALAASTRAAAYAAEATALAAAEAAEAAKTAYAAADAAIVAAKTAEAADAARAAKAVTDAAEAAEIAYAAAKTAEAATDAAARAAEAATDAAARAAAKYNAEREQQVEDLRTVLRREKAAG